MRGSFEIYLLENNLSVACAESLSRSVIPSASCDHQNTCTRPQEIIISGTESGVNEASIKLKDVGARSIIDLNVSAPFHCSLMNQASMELKDSIESTNFLKLQTKFISNVSANFEDDPQKIKELLIKQVFCRVRWRESILKVKNFGINKIIEIGAGKVLTGINKRMRLDIDLENVSNLEEVDKFMEKNKEIL